MEQAIIITEKYSASWRWILYGSLGLAITLFVIYQNIQHVVWVNTLRMIAFVSFAISVFTGLKLLEGKKELKISIKEDDLVIDVFKKNHSILKKRYTITEIDYILKIPSQISIPMMDLNINRSGVFTFQVMVKGNSEPFFIFHFWGRPLPVGKHSAGKLVSFFRDNNIRVINK